MGKLNDSLMGLTARFYWQQFNIPASALSTSSGVLLCIRGSFKPLKNGLCEAVTKFAIVSLSSNASHNIEYVMRGIRTERKFLKLTLSFTDRLQFFEAANLELR